MKQKIPIDRIELDTSIQCRAAIDNILVDEYAEAMKEGAEFPPVELYGTQAKAWIGDGWHRVLASKAGGFLDVDAVLHHGGRVEALKAALNANAAHGARRTNADKRRCVEVALKEFPKMSTHVIADMCSVSQGFVNRFAGQVNTVFTSNDTVTGKDGKQYPARRELKQEPEPMDTTEPQEEKPKKKQPHPAPGPPSIGMQFARLAIMRLAEITEDDLERQQAFSLVKEWINEHE